ncbi:MAG TPA: SH3 domain-containing protein [Afifellaceae bacterium]|nr:SH3 domain-containing protein [Afifellaceae bacterium]
MEFRFAVVALGSLLADHAWAEEARLLTQHPMPAPTPDVLWGPPIAPQHGFVNAPGAGSRQAIPKVLRTRKDGLMAKPGAARTLYVATEEGAFQMRAEPNLEAAPRGAYPTGTRMIVLADEGEWLRVLAPDGRWGWMAADFLAEAATLEAER